jgi:glycosyltransferase involved in cell wall biosynthesis
VEPGAPEALESAVAELVSDAGAAAALGTRARKTVERSYSWERYTDALWEVLSS